MRNLYYVNGKTFTQKKAAEKYLKELNSTGIDTSIYIGINYSKTYIETMRYYYCLYKNTPAGYDIYHAYKRPSENKIRSYERIKNSVMKDSLKVLTNTCQFYTTGSMDTDPETGEILFRVDSAYDVKTISFSYLMEG